MAKLLPRISRVDLSKPSVIVLIAANMLPLFGVVFFGWEVFPLLLIFWLENVIVGVYNVLKMVLAKPADPIRWTAKLFFVPFFCFHYGMFTLVHGVFVLGFFGGFVSGGPFPSISGISQIVWQYYLGWAVLGLALSHGVSLVLNYIGQGEYRQASLTKLMRSLTGASWCCISPSSPAGS